MFYQPGNLYDADNDICCNYRDPVNKNSINHKSDASCQIGGSEPNHFFKNERQHCQNHCQIPYCFSKIHYS